MSTKSKGVITGCIVLVLIVGTLNSIYRKHSLPGLRFYFGNGVLYLMLTFLGQFEEEIAKNLALAVAVFTVLGEGGGALDHFIGKGASNTTLDTTPKQPVSKGGPGGTPGAPPTAHDPRRNTGVNTVQAWPGLFPIKPAIPTTHP